MSNRRNKNHGGGGSAAAASSPTAPSSNNNAKRGEVDVRVVENARDIFKSIEKRPGAPFVAGLEPEANMEETYRAWRAAGGGEADPAAARFGFGAGAAAAAAPASSGGGGGGGAPRFPTGSKLYATSTVGIGYMMLVAAAALVALWLRVHSGPAVPTPPGATQGNMAPDIEGMWANVELGLDKVRVIETLKAFAVLDASSASEWLAHPVAADLAYHCFACLVLMIASVTIARAVPVFPVFICVGIGFVGAVAAIGDSVLLSRALTCFDTQAGAGGSVGAAGCALPLMMHAICVNGKWLAPCLATCLLIITLRWRGGLFAGPFRKWINLTVVCTLPLAAHLLRIYMWYTGLSIVPDAIAQHGWMLTQRERALQMTLAAVVLTQAAVWALFAFALIAQERLIVLESDESKKEEGGGSGAAAAAEIEPPPRKSEAAKKND